MKEGQPAGVRRPSLQFLCQRCQKIKAAAGVYWYCTAKTPHPDDHEQNERFNYCCISYQCDQSQAAVSEFDH
ncbi:hypothetical protein Pmani_021369 [Petrolisthes manimaculis]|uniref:Uncharacterized protein n=1 Tax=Petrolisthes manimaculis TaxID=1843537 RepID=A0AAE1U5D4_9EUCA|nr:hypothetical protein Pmani_021369 [Petrolisthes manimaculis]